MDSESVKEKEKLHDDIARIKAVLQSDGGEASAEESDDQLEQAPCPELAGVFLFIIIDSLSVLRLRTSRKIYFATTGCPF